MSSGYRTSWKVPPEHREDPAYRAAGRRMEFAQAVYDRRFARGWSAAELARRAGMAEEDIESIEESGGRPHPRTHRADRFRIPSPRER